MLTVVFYIKVDKQLNLLNAVFTLLLLCFWFLEKLKKETTLQTNEIIKLNMWRMIEKLVVSIRVAKLLDNSRFSGK